MKITLNQAITLLALLVFTSCKWSNPLNKTALHNTATNPPMMGWASWNHYRAAINEQIIRSQAEAMIQLHLNQYGYQFINIDDGFFGGRSSNGTLLHHPTRFPSGMKSLAQFIHGKGLKAGIYTDAGINTCASYYDKDSIGMGMGLFGHDGQDLNILLRQWDFDFLKVDWCGGQWLGLDEQSRYTQIGRLAKAIKPNVQYNICRWQFPGKWVTDVADSWRISGDIDNRFESIMKIVDLNAPLWKYCSPGHYNDMDMLQVGRGMTFEEDKTHFTLWCMLHSPLLLGNDLTRILPQTLQIITNEDVIALNQSKFVYQARRLADFGDLEIWAKPLESAVSGKVAVALLNRSNQPQLIECPSETIAIDASKGYTMKDLWSKEAFPLSTQTVIKKTVPPHGVVVLQINGTFKSYNVFQYADKK